MCRNIVVRAPNWVGDAAMSFPFFASLRRAAPDARIVCLSRPALSALFADIPAIDEAWSLDESHGRSGFAAVRLNAERLRGQGFDLAFSLPVSFGSALMLWLARIPKRVGHAAEGRGVLLTDTLPYGKNGHRPHRAEGYLDLLKLIRPSAPRIRDTVYRPGTAAARVVDRFWLERQSSSATPVLALAPGAAQSNKVWPTERFSEIARRWVNETEGTVVIVGGAKEHACAVHIREAVPYPRVLDLTDRGELPVAAEIIRRADVFLGNDSGLAHLAAAVGTPPVVISGPGDPREVSPFTPNAITVKRPLFCSPCYRNTCWRTDNPLECLTEIQPDEVWQQVVDLLMANNHGSKSA